MIAPTARGLGALVVFVALAAVALGCGWTSLTPLLVALGVLLLTAPIVTWSRARRAAGHVEVAASPQPAAVPVGGTAELVLRPVGAADHDTGRGGLAVDRPDGRWRRARSLPPPGWAGPRRRTVLAPAGRAVAALGDRFTAPTDRRGILVLAPLRVWVHDPLALFGAPVATTGPAVVVVHPVPHPPPEPVAHRAMEGGGELTGLRPYIPGDRLHRIHWPALALYDQLLVRHFDAEAGRRLVVDDRAGVHRPAGFEDVLSAVLALVDRAAADGTPVEVTTLSGRRLPTDPAAVLLALAGLAPVRQSVGIQAPGIPAAGTEVLGDGVLVTSATGADRLPSGLCPPTRLLVAG